MIPINLFSIHDLVGLLVTAPLSAVFYIIYFRLGRRILDLLFANWLLAAAFYCLCAFLMDNLVPAGQSSYVHPQANIVTLNLFRAVYVLAPFTLLTQLHFVISYCHVWNWLRRRIAWFYAASVLIVPAIWTPWWWKPRTSPLAETSSWGVALPWMPEAGPLQGLCVLAWASGIAYSLYVFYRRPQESIPVEGALSQFHLVRLAVLTQAGFGFIDFSEALLGWATIATMPAGMVAVALLITTALIRERISEARLKGEMTQEIDEAVRIQRGLLPPNDPPVCGYEITGWSRPARRAGGDVYDFFNLPDGRWLIIIGDASGHGLGAAMMISETRAIMRAAALQRPAANHILTATNNHLAQDLREGNFATAFVGILDPLAGDLDYASAGHGPIVFYDPLSDTFRQEGATVPPLGVLPDLGFPSGTRRCRLPSGGLLVLMTDGLYEAMNRADEQFGIARVLDLLDQARDRDGAEIIGRVQTALDEFVKDQPQADDMSMVVVRRRGEEDIRRRRVVAEIGNSRLPPRP
jgi:serine phosphatase RsbU (regulator of sigma subunit)